MTWIVGQARLLDHFSDSLQHASSTSVNLQGSKQVCPKYIPTRIKCISRTQLGSMTLSHNTTLSLLTKLIPTLINYIS